MVIKDAIRQPTKNRLLGIFPKKPAFISNISRNREKVYPDLLNQIPTNPCMLIDVTVLIGAGLPISVRAPLAPIEYEII